MLCSRIPDEDDDLEANHHQIQKEEEEEEDEDEDVERLRRILSVPCVAEQNQMREEDNCFYCERSEEKERARVLGVREGVSISIPLGQPHAYSHEGETVRM